MFTRECPNCQDPIQYKTRKGLSGSRDKNTFCPKCLGRKPRSLEKKVTRWFRECPLCHETMYYSCGGNLSKAIRNNRHCTSCHPGPDKETIKKIKESLTGKKYPNRASNSRIGKEKVAFRICPACKNEIGYCSQRALAAAQKRNSICNSCSAIVYKKTWNDIITEKHIQKMAATKAGYDTFEEYILDLPNKKDYYRQVRKITRKQDLSLLENHDKLIGLCGVINAYQVDHIIPVSIGYNEGIDPNIMGDISNLRIIPWQDNLFKGNRIVV